MKLYIDLRHSFAVSKMSGKFNGGNNSAQNMLSLLWNSYKNIKVICNDSLTAEYLTQRYQIESSVFVMYIIKLWQEPHAVLY